MRRAIITLVALLTLGCGGFDDFSLVGERSIQSGKRDCNIRNIVPADVIPLYNNKVYSACDKVILWENQIPPSFANIVASRVSSDSTYTIQSVVSDYVFQLENSN